MTSKRLTQIRSLGRYRNKTTGKEYNMKTGRQLSRSTNVIFYLFRNNRMIISDSDFYNNYEKIQDA